MNKAFKIYVAVMLLVIVLLLATLVGSIVYAGREVKTQAGNVNSKISNFDNNLNKLNTDLNSINNQLKTNSASLTDLKP